MIRKLLILTLIMLTTLISLPQNQVKAESVVTIKQSIVKHSLEMGIDPALGLSIAKQESGFCHNKRSSYGAVGVFQLMPQTAKKLGYNPYYLNDNIRGGLMYYKMMYKMFGSTELALAAYNAGPGNVKKYGGVPPFSETRRFVSNIMNEYNYQKRNPDPAIHKSRQSASSSTFRHQMDVDGVITNFMINQAI
ncbi:MAG: lytic transglycosylase domain-containing protein [Candidatus Gastranaerophilales bacterium]|nr:lytic transglycosylase domain-containing protein [Candidatus Gastranaerophilales bacterium]